MTSAEGWAAARRARRPRAVHALAFPPGAAALLAASTDARGSAPHHWDPATGDRSRRPLAAPAGQIGTAAFDADGALLATAEDDERRGGR